MCGPPLLPPSFPLFSAWFPDCSGQASVMSQLRTELTQTPERPCQDSSRRGDRGLAVTCFPSRSPILAENTGTSLSLFEMCLK